MLRFCILMPMTPEARLHWLWELLYDTALRAAAADWPTLYSSRIDGAILPFDGYSDD